MVGCITPERYDEMVVGYENELAELKQKLAELKNDVSLFSQQQQAIKDFLDKAKKYIEMPELTPELLYAFIQRVEVYEKPTKYSKEAGNPVMIFYKYQMTRREHAVAVFGITPEELADMQSESTENIDVSA